jgi:hypothetical protein
MKMSDTAPTSYLNQVSILSELWIGHKDDEQFSEFMEYNDLGLPLAYAVANEIVTSTEKVQILVEETFDSLLDGLGTEDEGFETLAEILAKDIG